jgi:putative copper resistance protein D
LILDGSASKRSRKKAASAFRVITLLLIGVRWLHISASILLAALFLFEPVIVAPFARKPARTIQPLFLSVRRSRSRFVWWAWSFAQISWIAWLWLITASLSGEDLAACISSGAIGTLLFSTQFGHLWLMRLVIGLIFGIGLWIFEQKSGRLSALEMSLAWLSAFELVSLAWGGHAVADPGHHAALHLLADGIHLLALVFWPGFLLPLATFLLVMLKSDQIDALGLAAAIVRRFSVSSLIAVTIIVLTGFLNSLFMVGNLRALLTTDYGRLLISKVVLFLLMVGFGAWNFLMLKPSLAVDAVPMNVAHQERAMRSLVRNILWEIALGAAVILIVAAVGITPPPMR